MDTRFGFSCIARALGSWQIRLLPPRGGGGAYSWEFLVRVCRPVLQILTLFQTKKCNFPYPFSDLAFRQKLCHNYIDWSGNKKKIQIHSVVPSKTISDP